tara:strand:+ start:815 stop:3013 length:2199 start_codon:yes stop_codon:yes gene_type:complete
MELTGIISRITYQKDNWTVATLVQDGTDESVKITGFMNIVPGEHIRVQGKIKNHIKFGHQVQVDTYSRHVPTTEEGVVALLGSGLIKGIGPSRAKWMVDEFGTEIIDMIKQRDPDIEKVPGIGVKLRDSIYRQWHQFYGKERLVTFLVTSGFSRGMVSRIINHFNDQNLGKIEKNPYDLMKIPGVGFRRADYFAKLLGIDETHPSRIQEFIVYLLEDSAEGNTYLPKPNLFQLFDKELKFTDPTVQKTLLFDDALKQLVSNTRVIADDKGVHLAKFAFAEKEIAKDLVHRTLLKDETVDPSQILKSIKSWENSEGFSLTLDQETSVIRAAIENITVVTGSPGTGKTSAISAILHVFKSQGKDVTLVAPTGRAAKRMQEATGEEASTMHRMLGFGANGDFKFKYDKDNKFEADVVVVDEVSMIDVLLMQSFLNALKKSTRLVLVGDKDQLQSISPGNVLGDIISSGKIPTIELRQVFRQKDGKDSLIISNSRIINAGHAASSNPLTSGTRWGDDDFYITNNVDKDNVLKIVQDHIPNKYNIPMDDILVLTPMRRKRGELNCSVLNEEIQKVVNPHGEHIPIMNQSFRVNDKVMQMSNDYSKDVFNGDIGYITSWSRGETEDESSFYVDFYGRAVEYEFNESKSLVHAWASTVHKAQGSEADAVVVVLPDDYICRMMLTRNLLYTAVTRAKKICVLVAKDNYIIKAIKTSGTEKRYTDLRDKIIEWYRRLQSSS